MTVDSQASPEADWYLVHGWDASRPSHVRVPSPALLQIARGIIADEVWMLAPRLKDLNDRLQPGSPQHAKVEATKKRPSFAIEVTKGPPPRRSEPHAARLKALLTPTAHPQPPRSIDTTAAAWLARAFPDRGHLIHVGTIDDPGLANLANGGGFTSITLRSGEGVARPSRSLLPKRQRPQAASLAGWLTSTANKDVRSARAFVLGRDAGELDVRLLRFVVGRQQAVLASNGSAAARSLLALWGGEVHAAGSWLIFTRPGRSFVDPIELTSAEIEPAAWPLISVITVSYNQAQYLERCLRSVLEQDYPNLEYIVIDAVSNDGSEAILRRYEPRLSKLVIEPDEGQSDGLNKGFDLASGEILTWINSDDELAPGALRRAAAAFAVHGADLITGGCDRIGPDNELIYRRYAALPFAERLPLGLPHQYAWHRSWERGDHFFQPEVLFTADIWRRAGGYLKRHLYWAMDWELWQRMALAGATIANIPTEIGCSRDQPDQKTTSEPFHLHQVNNILLEHDEALAMVLAKRTETPHAAAPEPASPAAADGVLRGPGTGATRPQAPRRMRFKEWVGSKLVLGAIKTIERLQAGHVVRGPELKRFRDDQAELEDFRRLLATESVPAHPLRFSAPAGAGIRPKQPGDDDHDLRYIVRRSSRLLAEHLMEVMFAQSADESTIIRVESLLTAGTSIKEIARELAASNPILHSRPAFGANRSLLVNTNEFPSRAVFAERTGPFRIVDVGAEVLSYEDHVYAPLVRSWPTVTLGFDPFCDAPTQDGATAVSSDGKRKVTILPKFIGSGRRATFHVNKDRATSSLLEADMRLAERFYLDNYLECVETREVETTTLDAAVGLVPELAESIDFLKIDVQGGSLEVLEGGRETLGRTLVCHLEAEFVELYKGEALFAEIDSFMRGQGFQLLDLIPFGRLRYKAIAPSPTRYLNGGRLLFADCIYVRQLDSLEKLEKVSLVKLAVIAHELYRKYDVAAEALRAYEEATGEPISKDYARSIT